MKVNYQKVKGDCFQGFIIKGRNSQFMSMFMEMWNWATCPLNTNAGVKTHADSLAAVADLISSQWGRFILV